ncbi:MAG: phosphatase PAP2 family protein, partial [Solirubrobacterales bacterium]
KATAWLDAQEQHPRRALVIVPIRRTVQKIVLPVLNFFGPQLRFAWERFTPGRLGLEFTTVIAVLAVAAYTFYFFLIAALDWPDNEFVSRLNDAAFRVAESIRSDWLDTLAEAITLLGSFTVAAAFTLIAAGYCYARRRVAEANVMVISLLLASLLTAIVKNWTEVPRPIDPLTSSEGWSFPSGHAAYAVTYVAIAISLERIRDIFTKTVLVIGAIILGGAIALSRVYLRVHYLSDVIGGTALGFSLLALFAALALLISHVRRLRKERRSEANVSGASTVG